jgi:glycerophosphoryl diester phosphodiesterase
MAGVSVVEVDVQLTSDGEVAVLHDEFLPDRACVNSVTLSELQARLPHVPSLQAVLNQARKFNADSGPLSGLMIVELKPAAPACDPDDAQERVIVSAVTAAVRRMGMTEQVLFTSFSPALLFLAAGEAPEIARILAINGLQFLEPAEIERRLGFAVVLIKKALDLDLRWAEIGPLFRLPGYRSIGEVLATAAVVGAAIVEADLVFLESAGPPLVEALRAFGFKVFGFTANDADDWARLEALGVDAIYTNDVPLGVRSQAPLP